MGSFVQYLIGKIPVEMVLELAKFQIKPEMDGEFTKVLAQAKAVISQAKGFISIKFKRSIESPTVFIAMIEWETLEDHTIAFRESDLFLEWRNVVGPFFADKPVVEHFIVT